MHASSGSAASPRVSALRESRASGVRPDDDVASACASRLSLDTMTRHHLAALVYPGRRDTGL